MRVKDDTKMTDILQFCDITKSLMRYSIQKAIALCVLDVVKGYSPVGGTFWSEAIIMSASKELNAIVGKPVAVNSETMILRVKPDGWDLPAYEPGQFVVLGLPGNAPRIPAPLSEVELKRPKPDKLIKRAYSIASSSKQKKYLEFYITLIRSGGLTPRLFALKNGDRIHMGKKMSGIFTLDGIADNCNLIFMGTGTGLAPYMSMIRTFLNKDPERKFTIIHGARHSWDLGYRLELSMLSRLANNFNYIPVISRPREETIPWAGETGYIQDVWRRRLIANNWGEKPTPSNTHVFLCGNPGMIDATLELLTADGFVERTRKKAGDIHVERWW
ncbi:Ferredoxin--NADP(+) reductase [hydrothermal vent metagenome]|uniref:ferredoxin--NADP(+) reductase n=1 Tax=hydrothermal vent metagenome TaxID=652676 RepID=A0A3B1BKA0_9ZZZZ